MITASAIILRNLISTYFKDHWFKTRVFLLSFILNIFPFYLNAQNAKQDSLIKATSIMEDGLRKLKNYNVIEGNCEIKDILKYSGKTIELADKLLHKLPQKRDSILQYKSVAFNDIGYYYKEMGKASKSVEYFIMSIQLKEKIKDSVGLIVGYNNIGVILRDEGDTSSALKYFRTAEELCNKFKKSDVLLTVTNQIAVIYQLQGNYEKALQYYNQNYQLAIKLKNKIHEAKALNLIGTIYNLQEKTNEAKNNHERALELFKSIDNKSGQAVSHFYIAAIYKNQLKDYKNAEKNYLLALDFSSKSNNKPTRTKTLKALGELYHTMKLDSKAYTYFYAYTTLRDSLQNEETKRTVLKKELQYSFDKKATADSIKNFEEQKVKDILIKANKNQLSKERTQRFALYGGIVFLLIFGAFIYNRFKLTQKQKFIIEQKNKETEIQKEIIQEKQKEILDSIHYAKRIQTALITNEKYIHKTLNRLNDKG